MFIHQADNWTNFVWDKDKVSDKLMQVMQALGYMHGRLSMLGFEDFTQLRTIEAGGSYRGLYHILGGKLAPLEGRTAESLTIPALLKRLSDGTVKEVILALCPDVEGRATEVYLTGILKECTNLKISRLAQGLPAGADISYADAATISAALNGRRQVE